MKTYDGKPMTEKELTDWLKEIDKQNKMGHPPFSFQIDTWSESAKKAWDKAIKEYIKPIK